MRTKRKIGLSIIPIVMILAVVVAIAFTATTNEAYADSPYTLRFEEPSDQTIRTSETEYVVRVFVTQDVYYAYSFEITYARVALLNVSEKNQLSTRDGVFTSAQNTVLEQDKTITKEDLTKPGNGTTEKYAYFEVKTKVNCAWAFTVKYRNTDMDEVTIEYNTKVLYCAVFDDAAPTIRNPLVTKKRALQWESGKWRINRVLSDAKNVGGNAVSGLKKATLYKRLDGKTEAEDEILDEMFYNGAKGDEDWTFVVEKGVVSYYLETEDVAGNTTGKVLLASFNETRYDADLETAVELAQEDMENNAYTSQITYGLNSAYGEYLSVTRSSSTEEEKRAAQTKLYEAYEVYQKAKSDYENQIINVQCVVSDRTAIPSLQATNLYNALQFLKRGDEGEITLTPSTVDVKKKPSLLLEQVGWERVTSAYAIYVETSTKDAYKVRRSFSSPLILKMTIEEHAKIVALQEVYDMNGNVTYYESNVVEYTDGTISVDVSQTAGTVYILLDSGKEEKNLYWLFSLTAIPLLAGLILLLYARKSMKKAKETARENEKEEKKEEIDTQSVKKNKKKKK